MSTHIVGLLGILVALGLLIFLAFRGFTLLLAAPVAAIVAAAFSGEPLLAKWTITFMQGTARFIANFFPLHRSNLMELGYQSHHFRPDRVAVPVRHDSRAGVDLRVVLTAVHEMFLAPLEPKGDAAIASVVDSGNMQTVIQTTQAASLGATLMPSQRTSKASGGNWQNAV